MYPPEWVCARLGQEARLLRLGWAGRSPTHSGALNCGDFCLVGLFQPQYFYDKETRRHFFKQFWGLHDVVIGKQNDGTPMIEERHLDRGPIFSKWGDTRLDYDPAQYIPVLMTRLNTDFVLNGGIALEMPRMLWESKQATKEFNAREEKRLKEEKAKQANALVKEMAEEAHDYVWWRSNKHDAEVCTDAKKHQAEAKEQIRAFKEGEFAITPEDV